MALGGSACFVLLYFVLIIHIKISEKMDDAYFPRVIIKLKWPPLEKKIVYM